MDIFFADDSTQESPSRSGMGQLVATGGIHVPSEAVGPLERALDQICADAGFPSGEEFKWSPRRNQWMYDNLVGEARFQFFSKVLEAALSNQAQSVVVVVDRKYKTATNARTYEEDATNLLIERIHMNLASNGTDGIVVTDRPGGGRGQEDAFLASCLETLQAGTRFVMPERIALNVLSTPSHLIRLLQLADVVTSSTLSYIAGEVKYAPRVFGISKPLFCSEKSRIGGVGIKLHPDLVYANLYHWLLGDTHLVRAATGVGLPLENRPYASGPDSR